MVLPVEAYAAGLARIANMNQTQLRIAALVALAWGIVAAPGSARAGWGDVPSSVQITNVSVTPRDAATATVTFDLAWSDSWRHEVNHDAVWVFFKVRRAGSDAWQPVRLAANTTLNPRGYGQADGSTPLEVIVPGGDDGFLGLLVRTTDCGQGNVRARRVTALWDIAADRVAPQAIDVAIRGFAIEMVYVPEAAFHLGSGGLEWYRFYRSTDGSQNTLPYRVTDSGPIPTGRQPGRLWARKAAQPEDGGLIPASFPNGYAAIYCMKKQVTFGQYADFLNTLPPAAATARCPDRRFLASGRHPEAAYAAADPGQTIPGGISWADEAAFLAWAGLRPITELEFEKIARGPMQAGWDVGDGWDHPSYWTVQELGGGWNINEGERTVTVANATGRRFKGTHGRGTPALPADWPQADAVGAGIRGGFGQYGLPSCRLRMATIDAGRTGSYGMRGARTAPREAAE